MVGRIIRASLLAIGLAASGGVAQAAPPVAADSLPAGAPGRVVSINLCTDQLAMMLAAPGQLISVSFLAHDPLSSAMVEEAARYPENHGLAEEIVLLRPDLVLAGRYSATATVALLQRLDIPLVIFEPENSFDGVRSNIRKMGAALGRQAAAERLISRFDADLVALGPPPAHPRRAALYYANGYTAGDATLATEILSAAGLRNIAAELGLSGGGVLALEQLVLADPDLLIRGQRYAGASRAEDILTHPALAALETRSSAATMTDHDWVCGTPHVMNAVHGLMRATTGPRIP